MSQTSEENQYIVMLPFMAQGHFIPFLALSERIHLARGYSIIFISTPLNIKRLRSKFSYPSSAIRFLEIPFDGAQHGLPPHAENTDSIPYDLILKLLEATRSLKPPLENLLIDLVSQNNGLRPLCLVSDFFFAWSSEISHKLGVFHALFGGGGGFGFACYHSLWTHLPHRQTSEEYFDLPDFPEASKIHVSQLAEHLKLADGSDFFSKFMQENLSRWKDADCMLFNSTEELDAKGLNYFRRILGRPAWPIGPLIWLRQDQEKRNQAEWPSCKSWLDSKPKNSVLYVSFGSQNTISAPQMMELAIALEASGVNFIWVVRPPLGFDINSEFKPQDFLPQGFQERVKHQNKGILVQKWASQIEILSHESVSAFLSHCGWNSVLEALGHGVPIAAWPLAAEQFYNAKLLAEEIGVCVEVARGKSYVLKSEEIADKIGTVMGHNAIGRKMRDRAMEFKEIMEKAAREEPGGWLKGSSAKAMDEFFDAALGMRGRTKTGSAASNQCLV